MVVYLLFRQVYINFDYGYDNELVGVYKNRNDAEAIRDKLYDSTTNNYYIEKWNVE